MNYHLFGDKYLETPNEPEALVLQLLPAGGCGGRGPDHGRGSVRTQVRQLTGPAKQGLNRALVNLGGGGGRGAGRGGPVAAALAPGDYIVTIDVAGETLTKPARVRARLQ